MSTDNLSPESGRAGEAAAVRPELRGRRLLGFRVGAILVGILPFVLLEAGLRVLDLGKPIRPADSLSGFNRQFPLFEQVGDVYRTARMREPLFGPQEFAVAKPTNGFRVFCFGGSTVHGHPYLNDTAFPKWLELELAATDPSRCVEVVNCGGVSYASYRLAPIVREVLHHQPDLIVLAMGHNDFLEDRTYHTFKARSGFHRWIEDQALSLRTLACARQFIEWLRGDIPGTQRPESEGEPPSPEVNPRLDDSLAGYASYHRDDAWHRQVVSQFEDTTRAMIADCRAAEVPVMLVTLGSNLRDCPPFKSEHKAGLTPEAESRWQAAFDAAGDAEEKDLNAALGLYRKAEAIDDQHALLAYRLARCLDQLGQTDRAREYYLRAKDQDICPLRMLDRIYQIQFTIAAETKTPLVDARKLLEALSPDELPGSDFYLDHVHPAIGGHQRIARAIAEKIHEARLLPGAVPWTAEARRAAYHRHFQRLPLSYFPNGRRRVEWLENWARRQRLYAETLPKDARGFLHQGYRYLDFEEEADAWRSFQTALEKDSGAAKKLVAHALDLLDQGRAESAQKLLNRLNGTVADRDVKAEIEKAAALMSDTLSQ